MKGDFNMSLEEYVDGFPKEVSTDFGFTTVLEDDVVKSIGGATKSDVSKLKKELKAAEKRSIEWGDKLQELYKLISPLLDNLARNPENEFIKWPNRDKKIADIRLKIDKIMQHPDYEPT